MHAVVRGNVGTPVSGQPRCSSCVVSARCRFIIHGRIPTLRAVVDHYDSCSKLGLSSRESDLVQYLLGR